MRKSLFYSQIAACIGLFALGFGRLAYEFEPAVGTVMPARYDDPTMQDVEIALRRMHITPETLAASGCDGSDVATVVTAVLDALVNDPGMLDSVDDAYRAASVESERLTRLVQSGLASNQEIADGQQSRSDAAQAASAQTAAMDALFATAAGEVANAERTVLSAIRGNGTWSAPTEFLVVNRSASEWISLREALANERIAAKYETESADPEAAALLQSERSRIEIALAMTNLQTNLAAVQQAWDQALSEDP